MAAIVWPRIRSRAHTVTGGQDASLRRVGTRLAVQTVMLLLIMVIALEAVVYLITRQALLSSLETTLRDRTSMPLSAACHALQVSCGGGGPGGYGPGGIGSGPPPGFGRGPDDGGRTFSANPSDASIAFVSPSLRLVHADGSLGNVLLSRQEVQRAFQTGKPRCCSVQTYRGQHFLVYTTLVHTDGGVVGAMQSSVSEHEYESTMESLMQTLVAVALLGLLCSGGISIVLVGRALQPIRLAMQRQRDFVADAAHELRTPLAIQRTVGEVAMTDPSIDELQGTVEQMLGENRHLTRLVEDLSLLARTDTNAVSIDRRPVDLSALVRETAAELSYLADAQGVTLSADVQGEIQVSGDLLRLRQLLLIMLDNALKHTPSSGTVIVHLSAQGDRARMQVVDSGPGIPSADLSRIFDRFYRSDQAREGEGTGLGLAIARWIVEAHGGRIQAGNTSPHGAVFTATLPIIRAGT